MENHLELAKEIKDFLAKHAKSSATYDPNYDDESDRFNGPDSGMLYSAAEHLERGIKPQRCWSDWGSGCYAPYSDKKAQEWHFSIMKRVNQIINS